MLTALCMKHTEKWEWLLDMHSAQSKESLFNAEQWQSNHWRFEVPLSTPNGWLSKPLTKPLWPFNTEGSLLRAGVGIYASCFVIFSWFGFIFFFFFLWRSFRTLWNSYPPMMQVLHKGPSPEQVQSTWKWTKENELEELNKTARSEPRMRDSN